MILTKEELASLVNLTTQNPHQWLGMHPLGDGTGVVVRAMISDVKSVEAVPAREADKPRIQLKRLGKSCVFEGVSHKTEHVFAYELAVTDDAGNVTHGRDPYSFWPCLGETDQHLFNEGNHRRLYEVLGAQPREVDGVAGTGFAVWAPNARRVSVVGTFNQWDGRRHPMRLMGSSGIWEIFIPGIGEGAIYKYEVCDRHGAIGLKTDPFGLQFEQAPKNAAIVTDARRFKWSDEAWIKQRTKRDPLRSPMSIYELHVGSWRKKSAHESLSYRELAEPLIEYLKQMGFTHVEFMPLAEHAYYPSWGYQVTGFYAPTSRYGSPEDLQFLINELHKAGIGVLMDWVPAHFPRDAWALAQFDGTALYEHEDPRLGAHQDWGTLIFNFGRHEVRNFLTANALFWCERFHIDGLRVDAVASMLYLDYSRKADEWIPNKFGGRENLEAIDFLREFNHLVHTEHPGVVTIAEESTAWPQVTRPPYLGGLGFSFKWNMGWMHDTLNYFKRDPVYRKFHQHDLTFAMIYHYHENFILPLSHDEVVHGKKSLRGRMPGDDWQGFANLRTLLAYQWLFPGKQLMFMGGEFGQTAEWNENTGLDWWLLGAGPYHLGIQKLVQDLNALYQREPSLWECDFDTEGFYWVDASDQQNSVLSFVRQRKGGVAPILVVLNLTPVYRPGYRLGVPKAGKWVEVLNTDAQAYAGSNQLNSTDLQTDLVTSHGHPQSLNLRLAPLAVQAFKAADA